MALGATGTQVSKAYFAFSSGVSSKPSRQPMGVAALRPAWASWMPAAAPCACRKATMRARAGDLRIGPQAEIAIGDAALGHDARRLDDHEAEAAQREAPRCTRCQSLAKPCCAEYWHMGAMTVRLRRVRPRRLKGEKSWTYRHRPGGGSAILAQAPLYRQVTMKGGRHGRPRAGVIGRHRLFDIGDDDLLHLEHGLHGALGAGLVGAVEQLGQPPRTTCQLRPNLSLHQLHWLAPPSAVSVSSNSPPRPDPRSRWRRRRLR